MYKKLQADFFLLIVAMVWGAAFPLMDSIIHHITPITYLAARFCLAAAALSPWLFYKIKSSPHLLLPGMVSGGALFLGMILQVYSIKYTTPTNAAFLTGLCCCIVPLLPFNGRRPTKTILLGVLVAGVGIFFLSGGIEPAFNIGDLLALLSSFCFAGQIILVASFSAKRDPVAVGTAQIAAAAVFFAVAWAICDRSLPNAGNPQLMPVILFTALLGTAFGFGIQAVALTHTTPAHAAVILAAEPVFAAVFAVASAWPQGLEEQLNGQKALGCALILVSMLICEFGVIASSKNGMNYYLAGKRRE